MCCLATAELAVSHTPMMFLPFNGDSGLISEAKPSRSCNSTGEVGLQDGVEGGAIKVALTAAYSCTVIRTLFRSKVSELNLW